MLVESVLVKHECAQTGLISVSSVSVCILLRIHRSMAVFSSNCLKHFVRSYSFVTNLLSVLFLSAFPIYVRRNHADVGISGFDKLSKQALTRVNTDCMQV